MHQVESLALDFLNEDTQDFPLSVFVLRHKDETRAVFTLFRYGDALQEDKLVRDLDENARAVAGLAVGTFCATVHHIFKHFERVVHEGVRLVAVDIHHHTHAAGVVFIFGVVQTSDCLS